MYGLVKCVLLLCVASAAFSFNLGDRDVIFHLFTRASPTVSQPLLPSINSIMTSSFSLARRTIFTIHNHGESVAGNFNAFVVPAHLAAEDVNIIAVDWSRGSTFYSEGLGNAPQCGRIIASFINILVNTFSYNIDLIRIVGVGLGGQITGITARHCDGDINHIVALDPSLHGWTHHPEILNPDDAHIVEVLHTTAGSKGYDYPLGDIDFYPSGGASQAGCGNDLSCSHTYAYAFYAESIRQSVDGGPQFVGTACNSYEDARLMRCSGARDSIFGGIEVKEFDYGIYIFFTNMVPPFARD